MAESGFIIGMGLGVQLEAGMGVGHGKQLGRAGLAVCLGGDDWWFVSWTAEAVPAATNRRATPDSGGVGESSQLAATALGEESLAAVAGLETMRRGLLARVMVEVATTGAAEN